MHPEDPEWVSILAYDNLPENPQPAQALAA